MVSIDLSGKRALVMGVTNRRSLGWSIAEKLIDAGATMAFSYQGERLAGTVEKLTADLEDARLFEVDVTQAGQVEAMMAELKDAWGQIDYIVHSIAFAPRPAMDGRYIETTRDDWVTALEVSAYSLVQAAQAAEELLAPGGAMVTLSYYASEKVVPKYNVMGIAKSALEASVRYLAYDLGKRSVRINAVSAGPVKTVAARSIPGFMAMYQRSAGMAPLGENVTQDDVGNLGLFLLSPMAGGITGETVYVDGGYHVMGMDLGDLEGDGDATE